MVVVQHNADLNRAKNVISADRGVGFGWRDPLRSRDSGRLVGSSGGVVGATATGVHG